MGRTRMKREQERNTSRLILKKKPQGRRIRTGSTGRKKVRKRILRNGSSLDRQMLAGARMLGGRKGKNRQRNLKVRKSLQKSGKQRNQKRNLRVRVIQRMKGRRRKREGKRRRPTLRRTQEQTRLRKRKILLQARKEFGMNHPRGRRVMARSEGSLEDDLHLQTRGV